MGYSCLQPDDLRTSETSRGCRTPCRPIEMSVRAKSIEVKSLSHIQSNREGTLSLELRLRYSLCLDDAYARFRRRETEKPSFPLKASAGFNWHNRRAENRIQLNLTSFVLIF